MSWKRNVIFEAKKIIEMYPNKRSALGPLLYLALREEGYITDESISEISSLIGITEAQVQSVATFYTMYKQEPTGKYLISVCKSISCEISASNTVTKELIEATGIKGLETDEEGVFSIEEVECIGACGGAPAIQVNYETIENIQEGKVEELCNWLRKNNPKVINSDEIQEKFGGRKSFDWGIQDNLGSTGPYPGFQTYKTVGEKS
ncbi:MAG: NAD(P)H-dependent oxidoreductase subunit E [Candidatus Actinomarinales bacterium]|nr:MAG: NAD(P)H-dependent oxidoreductase subunit E [Candidatus Actinomarinales bacterium]